MKFQTHKALLDSPTTLLTRISASHLLSWIEKAKIQRRCEKPTSHTAISQPELLVVMVSCSQTLELLSKCDTDGRMCDASSTKTTGIMAGHCFCRQRVLFCFIEIMKRCILNFGVTFRYKKKCCTLFNHFITSSYRKIISYLSFSQMWGISPVITKVCPPPLLGVWINFHKRWDFQFSNLVSWYSGLEAFDNTLTFRKYWLIPL